ncbi:MAG: LPS export ABC transporter permease LptG [Panacagrimonas sp.]
MSLLDRYIVRAILGLTGIVGLGLITIYSFISFVAELDRSANDQLGLDVIALYTAFLAPTGLYLLLPLIAMLGTLLGVGQLASQSELTAMRAAGYSNLRIGRAALIGGALLGLLGVVMGETLVPMGERAAGNIKAQAHHGVDAGATLKPVWLRDGDTFFHIRRLIAEDRFADADVYVLGEDMRLESVMRVDSAQYQGDHWQFNGITRTAFDFRGAQVSEQVSLRWTGSLSPDVLRLFVLEADTVSARGLLRLVGYLQANGLDASEQRLELWRKLVSPFTVMTMVLFAVPFVFGPNRSGGAGQRLLIGVLVGVSFHLLNEVSASFGALYRWPAPVSAGLPTLALLLIGLLRLARAR